jgi:hypothetical protein
MLAAFCGIYSFRAASSEILSIMHMEQQRIHDYSLIHNSQSSSSMGYEIRNDNMVPRTNCKLGHTIASSAIVYCFSHLDFAADSSAGETGRSAAAVVRHRLLHNIRQDFIHHG